MERSETTTSSTTENSNKPRPWQSYHTVYTNAKAGMEAVDKEKVQRVVYEMSKGSKYFENEERKEALMRQKIENMRVQCGKLTPADLSHYQKVADKRILELEATRDLSRIWLHVDMDAFYAAVETLSNPSLKGKPMAVGGMSMISTANYEARKFGVRAAMPGFIARKLCPQLIFVPTDFKKYNYYSDLTRKVFQKYDPNFSAASLDEAYLDITEACKERDFTGGEIAKEIRAQVYEGTGLTCSAGVAPNRMLAKVCSDINKPNGQFVLPNDRSAVTTFISSLPIRKQIGGIGKVTEHILRDALGINTCQEMLQKGGLLCAVFSRTTSDFFLSVGLGLGGTDIPSVRLRKSISSERTFSATDDEALLYEKLADIAKMLCNDMQKEGLAGRTLTLKLKTASFEVRSRAVTLQNYICSSKEILKYASKLLKAELPVSLRLIGLRISHFKEDRVGAPSDPSQKTITNFILLGAPPRKSLGDDNILSSEISVTEAGHDTQGQEIDDYQISDPLDNNILQHLDNHFSDFNGDILLERLHENLSDEKKLQGNEASMILRRNDYDHELAEKNVKNEAISLSEEREYVIWIADYKCSLCGFEVPSEFVEDRREHGDFHLAEKLQKEESINHSRTSASRQRVSEKNDQKSIQNSRKKRKISSKESKHYSIDKFFIRSKQNF